MRRSHRLLLGLFLLILPTGPALGAGPVLEWSDLLDGGGSLADNCRAAVVDDLGNLVVAGESANRLGVADMLIRKLDRETGAAIWERRIPSADASNMSVVGLEWDASGDLLVAGNVTGCGST